MYSVNNLQVYSLLAFSIVVDHNCYTASTSYDHPNLTRSWYDIVPDMHPQSSVFYKKLV